MDSTTPQSIGIVAIAGAIGRVAAELTRSLAANGVAVRALARDPGKAAPIIGGATPVAIDFADPDTLRRAGATDGCLTRRPSTDGEAAPLDPVIYFFGRGQERNHRVGDGIRGSPGKVMTRALDELQAGIG